MRKNRFVFLLCLSMVAAVVLSMWQNRQTVLDGRLFGMLRNSGEGAPDGITNAVRQYNQYSALFYNTGGSVKGLDEIPAAPLLKRRLFKDITMLKRDGLVMVFDRDRESVERITFLSAGRAVAESRETWFVTLQDLGTRKPLFSVKAIEVRARYHLVREPRGWIIYRSDVYPLSEEVPPFEPVPAL